MQYVIIKGQYSKVVEFKQLNKLLDAHKNTQQIQHNFSFKIQLIILGPTNII